jgi:hypothetical protein
VLRRFDRIGTQLKLTPTVHALLIRALANDWKPEYSAVLTEIRSRMLQHQPPLRFAGSDIERMMLLIRVFPNARSLLLSWATEDECLMQLPNRDRLRLLASDAAPSSETASTSPVSPTLEASAVTASAAETRSSQRRPSGSTDSAALLEELRLQRMSVQLAGASSIDSITSRYDGRAWSRVALHVCLDCFSVVASADSAVKSFRSALRHGVVPTAATYGMLFRAMLNDWQEERLEQMVALRSQMLNSTHPLHFGAAEVHSMTRFFCLRASTAQLLQQWSLEDGAWDHLFPTVREMILSTASLRPPRQNVMEKKQPTRFPMSGSSKSKAKAVARDSPPPTSAAEAHTTRNQPIGFTVAQLEEIAAALDSVGWPHDSLNLVSVSLVARLDRTLIVAS